MLLSMLAFNLSTILRNELEAATGGSWDLERFQQTVLCAGGRNLDLMLLVREERIHQRLDRQPFVSLWRWI